MKRLAVLLALISLRASPEKPDPALLILCQTGGVHMGDGAIAFGNNCVLHDKRGGKSAEAIQVYDSLGGLP